MAKKGQAVQLQQELNSDEDWDKMMQKDGLIVVDIYSEWCGPCSAMTANLKKLKLEVGGDNLQLAIVNHSNKSLENIMQILFQAKSDTINYLSRFRNKSEPTWMFIVEGKMVNLMFGANAPKLVRMIVEELNKEAEAKAGNRERTSIEISELSEEERVRYEAVKEIEDEAIRIENEKKEEVKRAKHLAVANLVLENIGPLGVILAFPQAKLQVQSTLSDLWNPAGLAITSTEKVQLTQEKIEELLYFAGGEFNKVDADSIINTQGVAYLVKPTNPDEYIDDIDNAVLELVYGQLKSPPGDPESPAQRLKARLTKAEMLVKLAGNTKLQHKITVPSKKPAPEAIEQKEEEEEEIFELVGVWAPPNALTKAIAIKLLFPKLYEPFALPETPLVPPHVAVIYEAFKRKEVVDLINEYRGDVIRYGFFTDDNPETTTLIAKTLPLFEKAFATGTTYGEKLVVQVSKAREEPLTAFRELGPIFVSKNYVEGEIQCKKFFPSDYDVPEEQRGVSAVKKKKKKGKKPKEAALQQETLEEGEHPSGEAEIAEEEAEGEHMEGEGESDVDGEGEAEGEGEADENNALEDANVQVPEGNDKATSPMPEESH